MTARILPLFCALFLLVGCKEKKIAASLSEARLQAEVGTPEAWGKALSAVQTCVDLGDESETTLALYALSLSETGNHEQAIAAAQDTIAKHPASYNGNYLAAKLLVDAERFSEAVVPARKAHELRPDNSSALMLYTISAAHSALPEAAPLFADLALTEFGGTPAYYNELALFYLSQGMPTKAIATYNEARAKECTNAETYRNLAIVYDEHMQGFPGRVAMAQRYYVKFLLEARDQFPEKRKMVQDRLRELKSSQVSQL